MWPTLCKRHQTATLSTDWQTPLVEWRPTLPRARSWSRLRQSRGLLEGRRWATLRTCKLPSPKMAAAQTLYQDGNSDCSNGQGGQDLTQQQHQVCQQTQIEHVLRRSILLRDVDFACHTESKLSRLSRHREWCTRSPPLQQVSGPIKTPDHPTCPNLQPLTPAIREHVLRITSQLV